jgi:hypothetical protein
MLRMDNSHLEFDNSNEGVDKSYISLSPSLSKLVRDDNKKGIIACTFKVKNNASTQGAVLFAAGEDSYYEDIHKKGVKKNAVIPKFNNLLVIGVGKIPSPLLDSIKKKNIDLIKKAEFSKILDDNDQSVYVIRLQNGVVTKYIIGEKGYTKFLNTTTSQPDVLFYTPGNKYFNPNDELVINYGRDNYTASIRSTYTATNEDYQFLNTGANSNYCYIGAVNVDGRYIPGNANISMTNFLIVGNKAISNFSTDEIRAINGYFLNTSLSPLPLIPSISNKFYTDDVYFMPFNETAGQHVFAVSFSNNSNRLYGLKLNVTNETNIAAKKLTVKESNTITPEYKGVNVYPNPTDGKLFVDFKTENSGNVIFQVYDVVGRLVLQEEKFLKEGYQHSEMNISKLNKDNTYILIVREKFKDPIVNWKVVLK